MLMIALLVFLFVSRLPGEISDAGQCKDGVKDSSNGIYIRMLNDHAVEIAVISAESFQQ